MSRMAKEGWEQASPSLVKRAIWCGTVFSLASLVALLNFLPPIDIHFRVRAQVIASPQRIDALREKLRNDLHSIRDGRYAETQLFAVQVLEDGSIPPNDSQPRRNILKLAEVDTRWNARATTGQVRQWLEAITQVRTNVLHDSQVLKDERFARWKSQVSKHYLDHFNYTRIPSENQAEVVASSDKLPGQEQIQTSGPMRFASTIRPAQENSENSPRDSEVNANLNELQLQDDYEAAQQQLGESMQARKKFEEQMTGVLAISGSPRIRALAGYFPIWLAWGSLTFAVAIGLASGWIQFRLQSGGAYEPKYVAELLAVDGLPCVDRVVVGIDQRYGIDWMETSGLTAAWISRRFSCALTAIGEWSVLFWCLVIALRLVFDPLWRSIFLSSPLAGLGRLLIGLP